MATIRDIAALAGVSPATVSRVLNHDESISVSADTRKKIFETAELLSYEKPIRGQRTSKKEATSLTIGLVHCLDEASELNDPYFISIRLGMEQACTPHGIQLQKFYYSPTLKEDLKNSTVDGLIVLGNFSSDYLAVFEQLTPHIVVVHSGTDILGYQPHLHEGISSEQPTKPLGFDHVQADFRQLTLDVLNYILSQGHTKIGFIGGHEVTAGSHASLTDARENTFRYYLSDRGLYDENYVRIGTFSFEEGYRMTHDLLAREQNNLPTCLFVASDTLAIGALRAIAEFGLSVPTDIAIIGCNDIPTSQYTVPTLSTVKIYTELMGETGVQLLLEQVHQKRNLPLRVIVPHKVVARESC